MTVTPEVQKERLIARNGLTEKEANDRINAQFSLEIKEAGADAVINNNGTIEESEIQLEAILKKWNVNRSASSE